MHDRARTGRTRVIRRVAVQPRAPDERGGVTERAGPRGADATTGMGVGARLRRKEDARFLRGRGEYVGDIRMVGMLDVAFVRSPVAHARIRAVRKPAGHERAVFTIDDLAGVKPIVADLGAQGLQVGAAARPRERQGAPGRRARRDVRRADARRGRGHRGAGRGRLRGAARRRRHGRRRSSRARRSCTSIGPTTSCSRRSSTTISREIHARAAISVRRRIRTARQCMAPIEGRGVRGALRSTGSTSSRSTRRRRCRTSTAPGSRSASASTRGASASSRPTSAAASATRASCCPRRSASAGSR